MGEENNTASSPPIDTQKSGDTNIQTDNFAGRDIHINYNELIPEFVTIELKAYSPRHYTPPKFSSAVLEQVKRERIVIIHGGSTFDKASFLKHLAFLITESSDELVCKELRGNHESKSLMRSINDFDAASVLVLNKIHPGLVEYDLEKLRNFADVHHHFILISTDISKGDWRLSSTEEKLYWVSIPESNLYHPDTLTKHLMQRLDGLENSKVAKHLPKSIEPLATLTSNQSIQDIALCFESPEEINLFVRVLSATDEPPTEESIASIIEEVKDESYSLIAKWFLTLSPKEKLISIGASLLDGMMDDQFFSVMQVLVKDFWEYSDSSLLSLDYMDIEVLTSYFKFDSIDSSQTVLKSRYARQHTEIIKAAWSTHRRHILAALPKLVKLVYEADGNEMDWEKYGTRDRKLTLLDAISKTISHVGMVSLPSVENILLELASYSNEPRQRIAARSISFWREYGHDDLLFRTLENWVSGEAETSVEIYKKGGNFGNRKRFGKTVLPNIKATAVMALAYAAQFDSPNELSSEIIERLGSIASDPDRKVKRQVQRVLPRLIHHHIFQLKDFLTTELMRYDDLEESIGKGIALAFEDYPDQVKLTLDDWLARCIGEASKDNRYKKFTFRDKVLATWFATYRELDYTRIDKSIVSRQMVLNQLGDLTQKEKRSTVRIQLFATAIKLLSFDFSKSEHYLQKLFETANYDETQILIDRLLQQYLDERLELTGNTHSVTIGDDTYPAWVNAQERPLTSIEKTLRNWLISEQLIPKKLAALAFAHFARAFEIEEARTPMVALVQTWNNSSKTSAPLAIRTQTTKGKKLHTLGPSLSIWHQIVLFVMFFNSSRSEKQDFKNLLITLKWYIPMDRHIWLFVLNKWKAGQSAAVRRLAHRLGWFKIGNIARTTTSKKAPTSWQNILNNSK